MQEVMVGDEAADAIALVLALEICSTCWPSQKIWDVVLPVAVAVACCAVGSVWCTGWVGVCE